MGDVTDISLSPPCNSLGVWPIYVLCFIYRRRSCLVIVCLVAFPPCQPPDSLPCCWSLMSRTSSSIHIAFFLLVFICYVDALPDLVVMRNNINPFTTWQTFGDNSCAVYEGCAQQGNRRLLRFTTQIYNQGTSDVVLGNPNNNPGFFTFSSCHHHYHRKDVVQAVLLDANTYNQVSQGAKYGWCLEDTWPINSVQPSARYTCNNQGLSVGWSDIYGAGLDCQWVDITGVDSGDYLLRVTVNANHAIKESNYDNNMVEIPVSF